VRDIRRPVGLALILLVALAATLAPALAPHDPLKSGIDFLEPSSVEHWLGTDELGRDILSRVLWGARSSLVVGFGAAAVALLIGAPIGLVAGYFRGLADMAIVPVIDLFIALPGLVLALIITVMVGPTIENLVLVLGFVMWPTVARLVRGQVLALRETAFIEAARAVGGSAAWIIAQHVWPNIMRVVAAQFAVTVAFAIFTSSSLSFLGLGIPPPTPDWGGMVRAGFDYLAINPMMSLGPGAAVTVTVLGFYLVGSTVE
jgi:peptide/nickel transport system permease protein